MSRYRRYLSFVRDSLVQHRKGPQLTRVVSTIDGTVLGAGVAVRAQRGVPAVASVAVGVATDGVGPAPVGVEHDRCRL